MEAVGVWERRTARNVSQWAKFQINMWQPPPTYTQLIVFCFPFEDSKKYPWSISPILTQLWPIPAPHSLTCRAWGQICSWKPTNIICVGNRASWTNSTAALHCLLAHIFRVWLCCEQGKGKGLEGGRNVRSLNDLSERLLFRTFSQGWNKDQRFSCGSTNSSEQRNKGKENSCHQIDSQASVWWLWVSHRGQDLRCSVPWREGIG